MRILIEPGSYSCLNVGDVAMLQVALERLRELWPAATFRVISRAPERLMRVAPEVQPIASEDRTAWLRRRKVLRSAARMIPSRLQPWWRQRQDQPLVAGLASLALRLRDSLRGATGGDAARFEEELRAANLVLVTGMGGINNAFEDSGLAILQVLEGAIRLGVPAAALGQGIGPLTTPVLVDQARQVLPQITLLGLREARVGPALVESLGVPGSRVFITGDDAIDLAYRERPAELGANIGVNLRLASYSGLDPAVINRLRPILLEATRRLPAALVPVPISQNPADSDLNSLRELLPGQDLQFAADGSFFPVDVIRRAGTCRVVVTGSYHAAVFALAQGVPAIGLVASAYYADKFLGLKDQFGVGCTVIALERLEEELLPAIQQFWDSAPKFRDQLLTAAQDQVAAGRRAYSALRDLVFGATGKSGA